MTTTTGPLTHRTITAGVQTYTMWGLTILMLPLHSTLLFLQQAQRQELYRFRELPNRKKNERFWNWNRPCLRIAHSVSTLERRNLLLTRIKLVFSVFTHMTKVLTTVAIRHVGVQTNTVKLMLQSKSWWFCAYSGIATQEAGEIKTFLSLECLQLILIMARKPRSVQ